MSGAGQNVTGGKTSPTRAGFTLLEVLLALMLTGMVLVGTTFFIFSMGELWGRGTDVRLFERHAKGMTRFLRATMANSVVSPDAPEEAESAVYLSQPSGVGWFDDPLITFELLESPPFLVWPGAPLPSVVCYLHLEQDEGLFLLWHSRLEIDFEDDPPRSTLLSPFVTGMIYDYYDPETQDWTTRETYETDISGEPILPTRIRLVFHYDGMTEETVLTLPHQSATVTLF